MREVKTLSRVNHPNVVRYYNSWGEPMNSEEEKMYIAKFMKNSTESYLGDTTTTQNTTTNLTSQISSTGLSFYNGNNLMSTYTYIC